jgi:hypothetical protein
LMVVISSPQSSQTARSVVRIPGKPWLVRMLIR